MILGITTNGRRHCVGLYQKNKIAKEVCWQVINNGRKDILVEIDKFLKKNRIKLSDLQIIVIYLGPGYFTSLRVGISIANTLGWLLNKPVIGVKGKKNNQELSALDIIKKAQKSLSRRKRTKFTKPVKPYYNNGLK